MAETFTIKRDDTSPAIQFQLTLGTGQTLVGATATFKMASLNGGALKIDSPAAVDSAQNILSYQWDAGDTDTAGVYRAEFEVTYSDGKIETFPNSEYIQINVLEDLD
ncbi:hypothetical protein SL1157_1689 [Ruegeria lacuscaerulensis ITI-1157]|nr:hypothetical protein SL1157_1689 [Ruegeria lacuscaerulensis ITI-1157]SHK06487.1 hypothetical protein SAMN05444404_3225 [Ruegeria lacuscaerulensis ITI-1157]